MTLKLVCLALAIANNVDIYFYIDQVIANFDQESLSIRIKSMSD